MVRRLTRSFGSYDILLSSSFLLMVDSSSMTPLLSKIELSSSLILIPGTSDYSAPESCDTDLSLFFLFFFLSSFFFFLSFLLCLLSFLDFLSFFSDLLMIYFCSPKRILVNFSWLTNPYLYDAIRLAYASACDYVSYIF